MSTVAVYLKRTAYIALGIIVTTGGIWMSGLHARFSDHGVRRIVSITLFFRSSTAGENEMALTSHLARRLRSIDHVGRVTIETRAGTSTIRAELIPGTDPLNTERLVRSFVTALRDKHSGSVRATRVLSRVSPIDPPCDITWLPVGDRLLCTVMHSRR